jgi:predicted nucleic acid-binding protein
VSVTLDANVLVYAIDATAGRRHREASAIVERSLLCQEGGIILHTMAEFCAVATRKLGTPPAEARSLLEGLRAVARGSRRRRTRSGPGDADRGRARLSFWMRCFGRPVIASESRYLLTEDFQDRRVIGNVPYVNPFLPANAALLDQAFAGSTGSSGPG